MNYSTMTQREVEIELSTSVSEGLTSFTAHDRLIDNGRNTPEKTYARSIFAVLLSQLTNLYTVAFFVMGIISLAFGFDNKATWILFFAVAVINMVSGFLRDNGERKKAVDFDTLRSDEVKVIRDSKLVKIDPTLLVKGDIVVLEQGDFVPCDIRILTSENCKADESIFKGRNVPMDKQSERMDEEKDPFECANMLYCGTSIAAGYAHGAVVATGKDTTLAKINRNKSKKLDMHDKFGKNAKSEKLLVLVALLCAMSIIVFVAVTKNSFNTAMAEACAVALCLLPAPAFIVRMIAMKVCTLKLEKDGARFAEKDFVYDIGMSEYFLFDKGGLITSSEMKLEEKIMSHPKLLKMAVICSDCTYEGGELKGNELDIATAKALAEEGVDVKKLLADNEKILFMPFDETRKLMASVTKTKDGYRLIVKGSIESIPTLCTDVYDEDATVEMTGEILHRLENISSAMAEKGLKVRAVAYRDIDFVPENIEEEIKGLIFVGVLGCREVLDRCARESIKKIENVYVKPVMVTGDHRITAATLARAAGLIKKEIECISFRELGDCTDEELVKAAQEHKVFASATNEDRVRLVRALSESGAVTAVAGEQMTAPSVAIYANAAFGDTESGSDVSVAKNDIENISNVIYNTRAMRANMAYVSLLALSVGLGEVLVMLFNLLTNGSVGYTPLQMLLVNLFVVVVPGIVVALLANVHHNPREGELLAVRCVLNGFISAIMCIASGGDLLAFMTSFAILEAVRICVSFGNLEKGKPGITGAVAMLCVLCVVVVTHSVAGIFAEESIIHEITFALIASVINLLVSSIRIKGLTK